MRWRQVVVLWVVAGLLAAQYVLVDRRRPVVHPAERPARPRLFPGIAADTVVGVRLEQQGQAVALRRHGEQWAVERPTGGRVAAGLVQAFVESLAAVEEIDRMPARDVREGELGFGDGALRLHVLVLDGRELHLTVGSRNAAGTAVYARLDDARDAVLIGRNVEYYASLILSEARRSAEPAGEGPIA